MAAINRRIRTAAESKRVFLSLVIWKWQVPSERGFPRVGAMIRGVAGGRNPTDVGEDAEQQFLRA